MIIGYSVTDYKLCKEASNDGRFRCIWKEREGSGRGYYHEICRKKTKKTPIRILTILEHRSSTPNVEIRSSNTTLLSNTTHSVIQRMTIFSPDETLRVLADILTKHIQFKCQNYHLGEYFRSSVKWVVPSSLGSKDIGAVVFHFELPKTYRSKIPTSGS
jgi:hypothetical protein